MNIVPSLRASVRAAVIAAILFHAPVLNAVEALLLQDTYVDDGTTGSHPANGANYGREMDLRVFKGNGRLGRTFLKFSLATLPPGTAARHILQARLRLWVNSNTTAGGSLTLKPVTAEWDEYKLTNDSASNATTDFLQLAELEIDTLNSFVSIDVTLWVKAWLDGTLRNEGILIEPGARTDFLDLFFDSKESTLTSHEARLEITLTGQ